MRRIILESLAGISFLFASTSMLWAQECFAVYGDSRDGNQVQRKIVQEILERKPAVVIHTGDMVNKAKSRKDWRAFIDITRPLRKMSLFLVVPGNHDGEPKSFWSIFSFQLKQFWFSIDRHDLRYIVLDTNKSLSATSEQFKWLAAMLDKTAKEAKTVVIFTHKPFFSVGNHSGDPFDGRKEVLDLFNRYQVPLVFSGHEHAYERFVDRGTTYVVTGGGGAPLHDKRADDSHLEKFQKVYHFCYVCFQDGKFKVQVVDNAGQTIDALGVSAGILKDRRILK